jgi:hypothetical protein
MRKKSPGRSSASTEPGGVNQPSAADYFETRSKKGRGMARRSLDLIEAMYAAAEAAQPITGRAELQASRERVFHSGAEVGGNA